MPQINLTIAETDTEEILIDNSGNRAYLFLQADPDNSGNLSIYIKVDDNLEIFKKLIPGQSLDYVSSLFNDKDFFEGKEIWISGASGDVVIGRYY